MQVSFFGLLAIVLITLKLCGIIALSWLWVLAPIWLPFAIGLALAGILFSVAVVTGRRLTAKFSR